MSYTVQYSNTGKTPIVIADQSTNDSTSISLVGRNTTNFGQAFAENFLHMLEHFAKGNSPSNPIEGQLWFDTSNSSIKLLKVYNGASWVPVNGLFQTSTDPVDKKRGDLWVNLTTSQLKVWNGTDWILIGPNTSNNTQTGSFSAVINDNIGVGFPHNVIMNYVDNDIIAIVSKDSFTPNPVIPGFTALVPGLNISTLEFSGEVSKVAGYSDTALNLKITNSLDPVSADNFVRNDTDGQASRFIEGYLSINSNTGLKIGATSQTVILEKQLTSAVLSNRVNGGGIGLSVLKDNVLNQIVTVDGNTQRVGINKLSPSATLDVNGTAKVSGKLTVGAASGTGTIIEPTTASQWEIGSQLKPFKTVYADTFMSSTAAFAMVPTGSILLFAGPTLPSGWLLCDGAPYAISSQATLHGVIGTTYGGAGSDFNVPDLTSRYLTVSIRYMIKT
jgi:hypothetical protein